LKGVERTAQNSRNMRQHRCVFLRSIASPVRAWEAPLRGDVCNNLSLLFGRLTSAF
jgi:hypothetical protein